MLQNGISSSPNTRLLPRLSVRIIITIDYWDLLVRRRRLSCFECELRIRNFSPGSAFGGLRWAPFNCQSFALGGRI